MVVSFAGGAAVPREKFGKLPPNGIRVAQTSRTIWISNKCLFIFQIIQYLVKVVLKKSGAPSKKRKKEYWIDSVTVYVRQVIKLHSQYCRTSIFCHRLKCSSYRVFIHFKLINHHISQKTFKPSMIDRMKWMKTL
jgi:hypothetical protein